MTIVDLESRMHGRSALGAYWKALRCGSQLSQQEVVARLRSKGLFIAVKQIWTWENGHHHPLSTSKALMDQVLIGYPVLSDDLVLYDHAHAARFAELERQMHTASMSEAARLQARAEFQERAQAARNYGIATAEAWMQERAQLVASYQQDLSPQLIREIHAVAAALFTQSLDLVDDWLRYGRHVAAETESRG